MAGVAAQGGARSVKRPALRSPVLPRAVHLITTTDPKDPAAVAVARETLGNLLEGTPPPFRERVASAAREELYRAGLSATEARARVCLFLDPPPHPAEPDPTAASKPEPAPAPTAADWPERPRLPGPPEPERLPLDVLPPALRAHVESVSAALQVPPELPELLALACVSAGAAGRVEVEPRAGWREPVGLYVACILPPAARKSPTYAAMVGPLREWEGQAVQEARPGYLAAMDAVEVARHDLVSCNRY